MSIEQTAIDAAFASDIGRDASYLKAPGPAVTVRVIPSMPDYRREVAGIEVQGRQRLVDVRVSEVANPAAGDTLTIDGVDYKIAKRPDRGDRCGLVWTLDLVKA